MAFAKIGLHPNFVGAGDISASSSGIIFSTPVDLYTGSRMPVAANDLRGDFKMSMTHQSASIFPFAYWGGNVRFHYHFFCNQFHSVKLRFFYSPGTTAPTGLSLVDCKSHVVEFGANTTHSFVVPFNSSTPWVENRFGPLLVPRPPLTDPTPASVDPSYRSSIGLFGIAVETPLTVSSDVVAPTVNYVLEMSVEDLRVAVPFRTISSTGTRYRRCGGYPVCGGA